MKTGTSEMPYLFVDLFRQAVLIDEKETKLYLKYEMQNINLTIRNPRIRKKYSVK